MTARLTQCDKKRTQQELAGAATKRYRLMPPVMLKCIPMSRRQDSTARKRRTTLSLPLSSLNEAERIARSRKVNLSTVIGEALSEGLRLQTTAERSNQVLEQYKQAFSGFSEDDMAILNGVVLQPTNRK